jgi:1,4-alpha-glucan branching enzyme
LDLWGKLKDRLGEVVDRVVDVLDGPDAPPRPTPPSPLPPVVETPGTDGPAPVQPSRRGGMGAIPYDGGTTFRVWAPNAQRVQVVGDFNGWDPMKGVELASEGNGNWSLDVPEAGHGQKYKLLIQSRSGEWLWRNDPRASDVTNSVGDSVIYDHAKYQWKHDWDFKMPEWNEAVIYEMHVGTFNDAPGAGPGNWETAIQRLDHLQDMGVNVIKMMPTAEFAGDFSWGYNPAFPFAPESAYGSPDDLKRFVDEAHKRGIGVVMDVVFNHLGPSDLPMWNFDGESHGNGGEYFYTDWRAETPWGHTRPDFGRHEVREYVRDAALSWLRDYHMDGLRFDATWEIRNHGGQTNPDGWRVLKDINDTVNREFPQKLIIAEDMQNQASVTDPRGANFDSQWDANFVHTLRRAVTAPDDASVNLEEVAHAIRSSFNGQATQRVIYSESHDEVANGKQRLPSQIGGWDAEGWVAQKKSTLAAAVTLTSPGIPMLFQGQEFLEDGHFSDGDPLDWQKEREHAGIENMYGDLIKLRRNWYNNTQGLKGNNVNVFHVNNNDKVMAYHRWDKGGPGDDTIVITNFSGKNFEHYDLGLPSDGTWKVRFNSDWSGYSSDFGNAKVFDVGARGQGKDGLPASGSITVPPYSTIILSKDR